jgi:hypothetical protein
MLVIQPPYPFPTPVFHIVYKVDYFSLIFFKPLIRGSVILL